MTRVLLVDDEPELLEAWSFALHYVGYDVRCARNGKEALCSLKAQLPDLLITDLMMPGMNGEELCEVVRANPEWARVPIMLHTSAYMEVSASRPLWDAVLRKPAKMEIFLATVRQLAKE